MYRYRFLMVIMALAALLTLGLSSVAAQTGIPAQVYQHFPDNNSSVGTVRPIFAWTIAAGTTEYRLHINAMDGTLLINQGYTSLQAGCGNGRCAVISPITLSNNTSYRWLIVAKNSAGRTFSPYRQLNVTAWDGRTMDMLRLVNQQRCAVERVPLSMNSTLNHAALLHSWRMIFMNFFDHTDPYSGLTPFQRMRNLGYNYTWAGENIAGGNSTVQATFTQWWNSSGHRDNMMNPNFREMGLGYATGGTYRYYWTMTLGNRSGAVAGVCP